MRVSAAWRRTYDTLKPVAFGSCRLPVNEDILLSAKFLIDESTETMIQSFTQLNPLLQACHDDFHAVPLEMLAQCQQMQFGPTSGKSIDNVKNFHGAPKQAIKRCISL